MQEKKFVDLEIQVQFIQDRLWYRKLICVSVDTDEIYINFVTPECVYENWENSVCQLGSNIKIT